MGSVEQRKGKWYLRYVDLDGTERTKLARGATTKAQAKPLLAAIELRIQRGQIGIEEVVEPTPEEKKRRTITVAELGGLFGEHYTAAKVKDIKTYRREARNILEGRVYPHLGHLRAAEVTTKHVDALVASLGAEGYSGSSVQKALAALSRAYSWGRKMEHLDCENPVRGAERPDAAHSLEFLAKDEAIRLLEHLEHSDRSLHAIVAFCLYTGARKGEAMGLRWQDLQLEARRVDILRSYGTTPKSGKPRHVPLNAELLRILRLWRDRPERDDGKLGLVFPVNGRMGRREEVLDLAEQYPAAGLKRPAKCWHILRHTFASQFMMAGGNILTLQKLLGHATLDMTLRYAHLAPDFMAAEVERLSFASPPKPPIVNLDRSPRSRRFMVPRRYRRSLEVARRAASANKKARDCGPFAA